MLCLFTRFFVYVCIFRRFFRIQVLYTADGHTRTYFFLPDFLLSTLSPTTHISGFNESPQSKEQTDVTLHYLYSNTVFRFLCNSLIRLQPLLLFMHSYPIHPLILKAMLVLLSLTQRIFFCDYGSPSICES